MYKDLCFWRGEIDQIDTAILQLFGRRMEVSRNIARIKADNGMPILDGKREAEVIQKRCEIAVSLGINVDSVEKLMILLMASSKEVQAGIVSRSCCGDRL